MSSSIVSSCGAVSFFFSSRRRHTRFDCDWSSDVCSSDLRGLPAPVHASPALFRAPPVRARGVLVRFPEHAASPGGCFRRQVESPRSAPLACTRETTTAPRQRSKPNLFSTLPFAGSCFVPFTLCRALLSWTGRCSLLPFLELPADHPNFEQNSLCLDLLANLFQLRRCDFFRTVRHI